MRLGLEHERRHLDPVPEGDRHRRAAARGAGRGDDRRGRGRRAGDLPGPAAGAGDPRRPRDLDRRPPRLHAPRPPRLRDPRLEAEHAGSGPGQEHVRLQLEAYGWLYEQTFGEPPVALQVHSGRGEILDVEYGGGGDALAAFERDPRVPADGRGAGRRARRRQQVRRLRLPLALLAAGAGAARRRPDPVRRPGAGRRAPPPRHPLDPRAARDLRRRDASRQWSGRDGAARCVRSATAPSGS